MLGSEGVVLAIRSSCLRWRSWRREVRKGRVCVDVVVGSGEMRPYDDALMLVTLQLL